MVRVKICGIREVEHALIAAAAGADFIGVIFAPSRRQIAPEQGREIVAAVRAAYPGARPSTVGVFADEAPEEVNRIAAYCGVDWVQLSGDESWEYCRRIEHPLIKAIKLNAEAQAEEALRQIDKWYRLIKQSRIMGLVERHIEGAYGGTGVALDWQVARDLAREFPFLLAGGLTPDNVGQAVDMVQPWGVDVSSGVETDGVKDPLKILDFTHHAKAVASPKTRTGLISKQS